MSRSLRAGNVTIMLSFCKSLAHYEHRQSIDPINLGLIASGLCRY